MAESENKEEKKLEVNLIKKENKSDGQPKGDVSSSTASPKKKVLVKRKTVSSAPAASPAKEPKKDGVRVVAKKASVKTPKTEESAPVKENVKTESLAGAEKAGVKNAEVKSEVKTEAKDDSKAEVKTEAKKESNQLPSQTTAQSVNSRGQTTFELHSVRPNVKAGNLSDKPRRPYQGRRDGQGGFTGAQAREGYQSRERENRSYGNGQGGYGNRQGGFQGNRQGGYGNRQGNFNGNRQGGFNNGNRQGGFQGNRQGGFNNGQGGQRTSFNAGRPNSSFKPGFGPGRPFGDASQSLAAKSPAKKQFKGKKQVYRKEREEEFSEDELNQLKKKDTTPVSVVPESIDIMETVSVSDLAKKMNLKASEIIGKLMSMGMMVTINQSIDSDTATILADEYNCKVHLISLYDETLIESDKGVEGGEVTRPPIVTVMGHVDHGKTKTLDAIRNAHVAEGEAGGITQKIGAYMVSTPKGDITFLDTPGHEAFTMMRARGAQITDIVVLVVAADDGVMPQTLEAIDHAKEAKVPIIVAVNKIDKPDANPDRVMTQLSEKGLTPEAWGGDTQYVNISALKREGIDDLLDAILIQAEMLELKVQYDCRAEGKVIESRIDQGRGVVASVIVQRGTLRTGDPFVAGIYAGRVRALFNDKGQKIDQAGPSTPVEVLGIESMPNAGDPFQVTETEKEARAYAAKRQELKRFEAAKAVKKTSLDTLYDDIADSEVKELKVIIKADLQGSAEALKSSLEKLTTREIRLSVIHSSAGAINESDVTLAAADSNAIIIGFNVRPTPKAKALAEEEQVEIRKYNIIYKCVEEIQQAMEGMLQPDTKEEVTGMLEVRNTFKVPKVGLIAGCYVTDGIVKKTSSVNVIRDGLVKFTGKVASLKRFKDDAKEVREGFECGLGIENYQDLQIGDQIEAFELVEVKRKLGQTLAEEAAEKEKHSAPVESESE